MIEFPSNFSTSSKWCMFVFILLAFVVLIGTFLDQEDGAGTRKDKDETLVRYNQKPASKIAMSVIKNSSTLTVFRCFSAVKNFSSMMDTTSSPDDISCIHGIRFVTMIWIVLEHVYINCITILRDPHKFSDHLDTLPMQIISEGHFGVDTFFLLSGLLQAYLFMKRNVVLTWSSWLMMNTHRYLRITPTLLLMMYFASTLMPCLGSGPYWILMDNTMGQCSQYWWAHALYVANFCSEANECLPWLWYLSNDMQFFFFGIIILQVMKKCPRNANFVFWTLTAFLIMVTCVITYRGDFHRLHVHMRELKIAVDFAAKNMRRTSDNLYTKPYSRAGPYLIGLLYGYHLARNSQRRVTFSKTQLVSYWLLAILGALTCIFGMQLLNEQPILNCIYYGIGRHLWGAVIGWVVYACATGNAGPINTLLSWKALYPLSRLSYGCYLIHPIFIYVIYYGLKQPMAYSFLFLFCFGLGVTVLTLLTSFALNMMVEQPVAKIEKIMFRKSS